MTEDEGLRGQEPPGGWVDEAAEFSSAASEPAIVVPGGWSAKDLPDHLLPRMPIAIPTVSAKRGGIRYDDYFTPQQRAIRRMVERHIGDTIQAQIRAIDAACWEAIRLGLNVAVQRRYDSRFVGIELTARTDARTFPTVTYHDDDYWWEDREDDGLLGL